MVKKPVFRGIAVKTDVILVDTGVCRKKTGVYSFMYDEHWCILVYKGVCTGLMVKKRGFKGYCGENRCIFGEYRCKWEITGVYSFMHDEYWCILVYKGVYTRIFVKKRRNQGVSR